MGTVLSVVDAIVLLLLIGLIPRSIARALSKSAGSLLLALSATVFVVIFAVVSFTASIGFLASTTSQIVWLLVLIVMAYIVSVAWANGPAK